MPNGILPWRLHLEISPKILPHFFQKSPEFYRNSLIDSLIQDNLLGYLKNQAAISTEIVSLIRRDLLQNCCSGFCKDLIQEFLQERLQKTFRRFFLGSPSPILQEIFNVNLQHFFKRFFLQMSRTYSSYYLRILK